MVSPARQTPRSPRAPHVPRPSSAQRSRFARDAEHAGYQLIALNAPAMDATGAALDRAQQAAENGLQAWIQSAQDDASVFSTADYRQAMNHLDAAFAMIERLDPTVLDALLAAILAASLLAMAQLTREIRQLSALNGQPMDSHTMPVSSDAIATSVREQLESRVSGIVARFSDSIDADLRRVFALGMVRGATAADVIAELLRRAGVPASGSPQSPAALAAAIASGLFARYSAWALGIVRTEIVNAYAFAKDMAMRMLDVSVWRNRWDATMDMKVCGLCADLDGEVRDIGDEFAPGILRPTAHPNCRCRLIPWRRDWAVNGWDLN